MSHIATAGVYKVKARDAVVLVSCCHCNKLPQMQAYLEDIAGLVPDFHSKASIPIKYRNKANRHPFAGERSCLQFVKHKTSVKLNKAKCNKTMHACVVV